MNGNISFDFFDSSLNFPQTKAVNMSYIISNSLIQTQTQNQIKITPLPNKNQSQPQFQNQTKS
mgnify:CR=1 FL=1|jgi:hypothetical protein